MTINRKNIIKGIDILTVVGVVGANWTLIMKATPFIYSMVPSIAIGIILLGVLVTASGVLTAVVVLGR